MTPQPDLLYTLNDILQDYAKLKGLRSFYSLMEEDDDSNLECVTSHKSYVRFYENLEGELDA